MADLEAIREEVMTLELRGTSWVMASDYAELKARADKLADALRHYEQLSPMIGAIAREAIKEWEGSQ